MIRGRTRTVAVRGRLSRSVAALRDAARSLNFRLLLIYFALFGFFLLMMPKCSDDYWFMKSFRQWFESQGVWFPEEGGNIFKAGFPGREIIETWKWHIETDNFRLGNIFLVPFLIFPKWVGSTVALCAWMYAVMRGFTLAGVDWRKSALVPLGLALFYVVMPWYENMGSLAFQFNYVVPSGLLMWAVMRLYRWKRGAWRAAGTLLLALIVGWWHEGFGASLLVGVAAMCLFRVGPPSRVGLLVLLCVLAGMAANLFSPGMYDRLSRGMGKLPPLALWWFLNVFFLQWLFFVGILILGCAACVRRFRRRLAENTALPVLVGLCVGSLALLYVRDMPRVGWPCSLFSVPLVLAVLKAVLPDRFPRMKITVAVSAVLFWVPVCVGLVLVDKEVLRLREQTRSVFRQFLADPTQRYVFAEYHCESEKSPLMMMMPAANFSISGWRFFNEYHDGCPSYGFYVVPRELEYVTGETGEALPGNAGFRIYKGKMFTTFGKKLDYAGPGIAMLDFGKGYKRAFCYISPFVSKADGRQYVFVEPNLRWYLWHFKTISGADHLEQYKD